MKRQSVIGKMLLMAGASGDWEWIRVPRLGGHDGALYKELFSNQKFSSADLLAREVIQNSWDAALCHVDNLTPFSVRFRFVALRGEDKETLVRELRLRDIAARVAQVNESAVGIRDQQTLRHLNDDQPIHLLFLEDFGAHGLFGDPEHARESRFRRALYDLGNSPKIGEGTRNSGGSYGYGKSAFIQASKLNFVGVYSCFKPQESDSVTRRAAASIYWRGHYVDDEEFTGRALLGEVCQSSSGSIEVNPFKQEQADLFAQAIGIGLRDPGIPEELGTTFCLLEPNVKADSLRRAVEKWWWPALQDEVMDIQIIDEEGIEHPPRPNQASELRPFIRAYELTRDPGAVSNDRQLARRLPNSQSGDPTGILGLVAPEDESAPGDSLDVELASTPWVVATVRKQRMIIEYRALTGGRRQRVRGTFVADPEIDDLLRASEPPLHDSWKVNTDRDVSAGDRRRIQDAVRMIRDQIIERVREFALHLEPRETERQRPIQEMDDLISQLASGRRIGPPPRPPSGTLPVRITGDKKLLYPTPHTRKSEFTLELQLLSSANRPKRLCLLEPGFRWDEGGRNSAELVPLVVIESSPDAELTMRSEGVFELKVFKSHPVTIRFQTETYPGVWTINGNPRVRFSSDLPNSGSREEP